MGAQAPRIEAQQGSPLPFDAALSVYVAHNGTWINYATMQDEPAEIEDPVAAFAPEEEVSDEIDVWGAHQINLPTPPPGWTFFEPTEGEPMHLHVVVRDTDSRLCEVIVKEWGTETVIATLPAGQGGGEVTGSIPVEPTTKAFQLEATTSAGTTLFFAGANNPTVNDVVAISPCAPANVGNSGSEKTAMVGTVSAATAETHSSTRTAQLANFAGVVHVRPHTPSHENGASGRPNLFGTPGVAAPNQLGRPGPILRGVVIWEVLYLPSRIPPAHLAQRRGVC